MSIKCIDIFVVVDKCLMPWMHKYATNLVDTIIAISKNKRSDNDAVDVTNLETSRATSATVVLAKTADSTVVYHTQAVVMENAMRS